MEAHVVQVGRNSARHIAAGDDVALALDREQLQDLGDLQVFDGDVDLAQRVDGHARVVARGVFFEQAHGVAVSSLCVGSAREAASEADTTGHEEGFEVKTFWTGHFEAPVPRSLTAER